jgi:hypothetical protein
MKRVRSSQLQPCSAVCFISAAAKEVTGSIAVHQQLHRVGFM